MIPQQTSTTATLPLTGPAALPSLNLKQLFSPEFVIPAGACWRWPLHLIYSPLMRGLGFPLVIVIKPVQYESVGLTATTASAP